MLRKNISTKTGSVMLVIISITIFLFVWKLESLLQAQQDITGSYPSSSGVLPSYPPQISETVQKKPREVTGSDMIPTTLWKTYSDRKNGYSIKYPENWLFDIKDGASFYVKEFLTEERKQPLFRNKISENLQKIYGDYFININVYPKIGTHVTLEEWRQYDKKTRESYIIKGNLAIGYKTVSTSENAGSITYYFIRSSNQDGYEITIYFNKDDNGIADRMISTLKFSDEPQYPLWKSYSSSSFSPLTQTEDWNNYSFINESQDTINVSLQYPGNWTLNLSVFSDEDGNKIAEFSPGLVILKEGQHCFDTAFKSGKYSELVSKNSFRIGSINGVKEVRKTYPDGSASPWYPNAYCIEEKSHAFTITFYDWTLDSKNQKVFDEIISSFKFISPGE